MIVDERIVDYIHSLETRNSDILETIEQEALKERVPIIRKEMQSFLKVLLLLKRPKRILEIGTAVAFSAILMSEYTSSIRLKIMRNEFKRQRKISAVPGRKGGFTY